MNVLYNTDPNPERNFESPWHDKKLRPLVPTRALFGNSDSKKLVTGVASTVLKGFSSLTPHRVGIDLS